MLIAWPILWLITSELAGYHLYLLPYVMLFYAVDPVRWYDTDENGIKRPADGLPKALS